MSRQPRLVLVVKSAGGHQIHPRKAGDLAQQVDIPPQVDGRTVYDGGHPGGLGPVHLVHRPGQQLLLRAEPGAEVGPHRPVPTANMLMGQGKAHLVHRQETQNGVDVLHIAYSLLAWQEQAPRLRQAVLLFPWYRPLCPSVKRGIPCRHAGRGSWHRKQKK